MFSLLFLCFFTSLSLASCDVLCHSNESVKVVCPDDYYCCRNDMCCKSFFPDEDDDGEESENRETYKELLWDLCMRTFIVCLFMCFILLMAKSVQYFRRYYLGPSSNEETNLPRYVPLEKNSIVTDVNDVSILIGTPFYQVSSGKVTTFKNSGGIPI